MSDTMIKIENLKKRYTLGAIGGQTLAADINIWWAKVRGKENPYAKIGEDTSKYGQQFNALDGINLEIKKGEAVGVIGTNGAGKSTLLKILSRVTAPTEGTVCINGRISSMLEVGTGFHPELTGRENIYMNGAILGMTKAEIDSKVDEIIEFSECRQFIDTPVKRYSSGMYVKLAFAVAAHLDSDIMIMDEVLAVGDVKFQQKCLGKMGDEANNEGKTILYVSHNMATVRQLCTRCIVLDKGRVLFDGDTEEAISIYVGSVKGSLENTYNFHGEKRVVPEYGKILRVNSLEFLDVVSPSYQERETMKIRLSLYASEKVEGVRAYFAVKQLDDTPVCLIETGVLCNMEKDQEKNIECDIDLETIVEGSYYFRVSLFVMNPALGHTSYEQPQTKIFFDVVGDGQNRHLRWARRYWGNNRLDKVLVIGGK